MIDLGTPSDIADPRGVDKTLRALGSSSAFESPGIGICGARNADERALELARLFGEAAAEIGLAVVSGNARGVDDEAQFGALSAGGDVALVLAQGLAGWRPRARYRPLIASRNFIAVSEFDDDERWQPWRAMQRNSLIIGLSRALVVVQAGESGGTWEAGLRCLELGKPLLVVQREEEPPTTGNKRLIERGGRPVNTMRELKRILVELRDGEPVDSGQGHLDLN